MAPADNEPNASIVRLVSTLFRRAHEGAVARRYMSADSITNALHHFLAEPEEVMAIEAPPDRQERLAPQLRYTT